MRIWCFLLGLPCLAYGLASVIRPAWTGRALLAFTRYRPAGWVLAFVGWLLTAYELDTIGIEIFDRFTKAFPGELWILAIVLTVLTCWWMDNLLPIRGVCALFMLFPAEMFPAIRLCETQWRLWLVVFAYICLTIGMFGMFYPWHIRRALEWRAKKAWRIVSVGALVLLFGVVFLALGLFGKCA